MKLTARVIADGTDFIGTKVFRPVGVHAGRNGLGDCICELSNLINADYNQASILVPRLHPAFKDLQKLYDLSSKYEWQIQPAEYNDLKKFSSHEEIEREKGLKLLPCYPEYSDYAKLNKSQFIKTDIPTEPYATIQRVPFAKKCLYTKEHIEYMESQYNIKIIDVGGREDLGLAKVAYIIDNAQFHIGLDSGMSHYALTIKNKEDVHIYVPEDRITGVTYRWMKYGYNIKLMER